MGGDMEVAELLVLSDTIFGNALAGYYLLFTHHRRHIISLPCRIHSPACSNHISEHDVMPFLITHCHA